MCDFNGLVGYDLTEGKGGMVVIGYFLNQADALYATKGWGVMGYGDGEVKELNLYSSVEDWEKHEKLKLKASALAKLTLEERKALGF